MKKAKKKAASDRPDFAAMRRAEIQKWCQDNGVKFDPYASKEQLVEALTDTPADDSAARTHPL